MPEPTATNPMALASLVMGILSIACVCVCYGFPFNVLGIVLGAVAIMQANQDPSQGGKSLAMAGIGLSVLSFVLLAVLLVLGVAGGMMSALLEQM
jgi:hypothetical protein